MTGPTAPPRTIGARSAPSRQLPGMDKRPPARRWGVMQPRLDRMHLCRKTRPSDEDQIESESHEHTVPPAARSRCSSPLSDWAARSSGPKRRFEPANNRLAAIVLLADAEQPYVYLVPSTAWRSASPPLTDRDNIGKRSEPPAAAHDRRPPHPAPPLLDASPPRPLALARRLDRGARADPRAPRRLTSCAGL